MRIAMWSGPRNLSTAMMYSFGNRADFAVVDEPFYGAYLKLTGLQHPMREEVLARHETDERVAAQGLLGPIPDRKAHIYQKHMTQHMVPGMPMDWVSEVTHVFLLRHPARVIASFAAKHNEITDADIGFQKQAEIFDHLNKNGPPPLVIDSADIRANPEQMLKALCQALSLSFDPAMLAWPSGGHPSDGIWGDHWYDAVRRSTGFAGPEGPLPELDGALKALEQKVTPFYEALSAHKMRMPVA